MPGQPDGAAGDRSTETQRLRFLFRLFAAGQCHGRSPVYEALSEAVAADGPLLDLLIGTPAGQWPLRSSRCMSSGDAVSMRLILYTGQSYRIQHGFTLSGISDRA